jgi:uncharacterized protein
MRYTFIPVLIHCSVLIVFIISCINQTGREEMPDYPIKPVPFTDVHLKDSFWLPRILTNSEVTIPIAFKHSEETGRIRNFEVAAGLAEGTFSSIYPFDDSDVFKIMEGAAYSLMSRPDKSLEDYLDSLIWIISLAQEEDGYLYTNRTILGEKAPEWAGNERWQHVREHSHELYNAGHMYEAAVAHFMATGKREFLDVAIKNANLVDRDFGWGKLEKYPGHQEIEIGLVKLYRVTGDEKYLNLARFFLDVRGPGGWEYNQAHQKVVDQYEPVGHAVRALYMYSGMADIAALTGDQTFIPALHSIWENITGKKFYITGGVGQTGGNEGFGPDYDLPNYTAYCETCASIASVFWNHRMFLLSGEAKYIDILERTMYNALLSGVSVNGERFFYPNPLGSDGSHQRQEWFGCACCPSNICRFLPSVPGYVYARTEDDLFVNLYIASEAEIMTGNGKITIYQTSNYPWDGNLHISITPEKTHRFRISLRIPGWAMDHTVPGDLYRFSDRDPHRPIIAVNGQELIYSVNNGYAIVERDWTAGDIITVRLPMPVRKVLAHDAIEANHGRFAIQKGPLVYCLEEADNPGVRIRNTVVDLNTEIESFQMEGLLPGMKALSFYGRITRHEEMPESEVLQQLTAIPYAFWANREAGEMVVWIGGDRSQKIAD